jgi:tetratricopeptide (TPR) repeat protein
VLQGDFEHTSACLNRVIEIFDDKLPFPWELAPTGYIEAGAKGWLMVSLQITGQIQRAEELAKQQFAFAVDHKDSMSLYHIHTFPALYKLLARDWMAAETIIEDYLPIVRAFGDPVFNLTAEVYAAISKAFQGKPQAFETAVHLINVCMDVGFRAFAVAMARFIAELYYHQGDHEATLGWIERILTHVNKTGSHINTSELHRVKGLTLIAMGRPDEDAASCFQEAQAIADRQGAKVFKLRACVDLARLRRQDGKQKESTELLRAALKEIPYVEGSVDIMEARALLDELIA